jgi:hypothetical protein
LVPCTQRAGSTLPGGFVPQPELAVWKERSDGSELQQSQTNSVVVVVELDVVVVGWLVVLLVVVLLVDSVVGGAVSVVPVVLVVVVSVVGGTVSVVAVVLGAVPVVLEVVSTVVSVVLEVVATVVLVVVVPPGQTQPGWHSRNAPVGEFGSGQLGLGWPGGSQSSPGSTISLPHGNVVVVEDDVALVVLVVSVVDVVVCSGVVVVVVVAGSVDEVVDGVGAVVVVVGPGAAHPSGPQASQQLGTLPVHASPSGGARQRSALRSTLQRVSPNLSVRQQVT